MALVALTAPEQHISPEMDGLVRFRPITDGRLTGCGVTVSGTSFSVGAGYWLINGRLVQNTAAASVAIGSGSGNYAFLVLTFNLNATPMVSLSVVRSSSSAFPSITQDNLNNGTGTTYQVILAAAKYASNSWTRYYELNFCHGTCIQQSVLLPSAGWTATGSEQTITVATNPPWQNPDMAIEAFPTPATRANWIAAGVYLYEIGVGTLTFRAASVPVADVRANLRGF